MKQHERHRLAHEVASSDDHGVPARDGNARAAQQLHHTRWRAGGQDSTVLHQAADIHCGKTIDILAGSDQIEHATLGIGPHRRRQR